jgi:hypothetical protein
MALRIFTLVAGLACRPQRSWLLSLHNNQHDTTPSFLKSFLNFFVTKSEKSGVALTMSLGKWETIAVKRHYRPRVIRLYGIDPCWSEPANDVRSHCRPRCNNQPWKLILKNWKLKNLRAFLGCDFFRKYTDTQIRIRTCRNIFFRRCLMILSRFFLIFL